MKYKKLKAIRQWTKNQEFDVEVCRGPQYEIELNTNLIFVADQAPTEARKSFDRLCQSFGLMEDADMNTMALLHEIGHSETYFAFNSFILFWDKMVRQVVNHIPVVNETIQFLCYYIYHRLPLERAATEWACNWVMENEDEYEELKNILGE